MVRSNGSIVQTSLTLVLEKRRPIVASQLDSVTEEEVAQFVRHSASQKEVMSQFCSTMESLSNLRGTTQVRTAFLR